MIPMEVWELTSLMYRYIYACTKGNAANHPCPWCMVHKDLANLTLCSLMHNHPTSQKAVADTLEILAEGWKDNANKHMAKTDLYLIDVSCVHWSLHADFLPQNVFWGIKNTDVHCALSVNNHHTLYIGIFSTDTFPLIIDGLSPSGKTALMWRWLVVPFLWTLWLILLRFDGAPAYPGMKRMYKIDALSFADGEKYFSVLQVRIFAQWYISWPSCSKSYLMLLTSSPPSIGHCSISFKNCWKSPCISRWNGRPHLSFRQGVSLLAWQMTLRLVCSPATVYLYWQLQKMIINLPEKNLAFPKMHQLVHLFDDEIMAKGTDEYLHCKIGENMHQGLIQCYAASNKKDFIKQVCKYPLTAAPTDPSQDMSVRSPGSQPVSDPVTNWYIQ